MKREKKDVFLTLDVQNVSKNFDSIVAVDNVSFQTNIGEIIAILGPNGAGKSTLMNMIAGYLNPTQGKIFVNKKDMEYENLEAKRNIGFLPEGAPMYEDMSVYLFLKYFIELKLIPEECLSKNELKALYKKELERIVQIAKIQDVLHQKIETLSKGYTRRVGFAASLIGNPPILLLDEPTDGLDPNQKTHMRELIKNMSNDKTILISTHLLEEAETLASKIVLINKGKIIIYGTLKEILAFAGKKSLKEAFAFLTNGGESHE